MNTNETKKLLAMVAATYANATLNEASIVIWNRIFSGIDYAVVERAFFDYAKTPNRFPPAPGEILEIIRTRARGQLAPAEVVWEDVLLAAPASRAPMRTILPEAAQKAMRQVGWRTVAMAHIDKELPWLKKRFCELYEGAIDSELTEKLPHFIKLTPNNHKELE